MAGTRNAAPRDKRALVIDAAVEVFLANGFDKTSMDAVAAAAGVSKTTVYAHYADKVELFQAVVKRAAEDVEIRLNRPRVAPTTDPESRLTQLVYEVLRATTGSLFLALMRVMITESSRRPELTRVMQGLETPNPIGLIARVLQEDAETYGYEMPEPWTYAVALVRMAASSLQLDCLVVASFEPDDELLHSHAEWMTEIFLRGIRPREADQPRARPIPAGYSYPWVADMVEAKTPRG